MRMQVFGGPYSGRPVLGNYHLQIAGFGFLAGILLQLIPMTQLRLFVSGGSLLWGISMGFT